VRAVADLCRCPVRARFLPSGSFGEALSCRSRSRRRYIWARRLAGA
jgi:hypothetical protein